MKLISIFQQIKALFEIKATENGLKSLRQLKFEYGLVYFENQAAKILKTTVILLVRC